MSPPLHPRIAQWFAERDWQPFAFQLAVWSAYREGASGLIHSATGTGKTLAAFMGPVMAWLEQNPPPPPFQKGGSECSATVENPPLQKGGRGDLKTASKSAKSEPLTVLWITPMRALAADTLTALQKPVEALGLPWSVGARTGDTSSAERARQAKRLPTVLVTTPESLSLMLASTTARETLANIRSVVVDEWHELMGTKRGVQTELALARLRRWSPAMRVWGVSATLGNLDEAMACLLGVGAKQGAIIRGETDKQIVIDTLMPPEGERFPWAGHLGLVMLGEVIAAIEQSNSTLVFTNTRSQAELWYQGLLAAKPEWAGDIALHHGSLDLDVRRWVEGGLKSGTLKAVVATSSLDLGVDFSPVERVLQVGSPKGVARLLQRAGRSGHAPGQVSRVSCVPSHAFEYIEAAAARVAAQAGKIESRPLIAKPLDLLTQHLVTLALGEGFRSDDLFDEVRSAWSYRDLTREEWNWALDFVTKGGAALCAYEDYRKVVERDGLYRVENATIARRHRMNIGTIVSDASVAVVMGRGIGGKKLGFVEESFAARLSPGDAFIFAGRTLEFIRMQDMTAFVKAVAPSRPTVPRWNGGRMPLSSQLAESVREMLERHLVGGVHEPEFAVVEKLLKVQRLWSRIPRRHELLFEQARSREGHHLFCFPFEGRAVHTALAALFGYRIGRLKASTFTFSVNDYGFELMARDEINLHEALRAGLLATDHLFEDVVASLNAAELAKRHFREIARVAGLVFQGYPGAGKSNKQLQASSGLIYDVFARFDANNPLLGQTRNEVLQRELEYSRLGAAMQRFKGMQVLISKTDRPSPFAFPLMVERLYEKLSSETLADRVARMQLIYDEVAR
ncbi:MAG: ligase-associated DNA damage response DEXH box helicase [Burkholderiales bacterium]|nr:ligase-associated DNA damage response DEXH box helicase [Burkholderiales bacterium]